jgi:hypothetical protein
VLLCGAAVFISYIDRTNISVAAIPMQTQFGWTRILKSTSVWAIIRSSLGGTVGGVFCRWEPRRVVR